MATCRHARRDDRLDVGGLSQIRPELELLLCCGGTRLRADRAARIGELARLPLDWDWLIGHARRHALDPLLHRHLSALGNGSAPASAIGRLETHRETNAVRNRLLIAELGKVLARLDAEGIAAMPYKGPVLAALAYGDLALRRSADLDVLVSRGDAVRAVDALGDLGYEPRLRLTAAQQRAYLASQCEYALDRNRGRLTVEVHWDVAPPDFALRLDLARVWRRARPVECGGLGVLAPATEDLLLILVVHGSKHLWERLAWLVDVAQLIETHPGIDWARLREEAREQGAARLLRVALRLLTDLLGLALPAELSSDLARDRTAALLAARIARWVAEDTTPRPRSLAALRAHAALRERPADRARLVLRTLATPTIEDWASVRLPAALLPLHYIFRPFRLAAKRAATAGRGPDAAGR